MLCPSLHNAGLMLASTLAWICYYCLVASVPLPKYKMRVGQAERVRLSQHDVLDCYNRIASITHTYLTIFGGFYSIVNDPAGAGTENTYFQTWVIMMSFSYNIYDIFCMYYCGVAETSVVMHHVAVSWGMYFSICTNICGYEYM